MKFRALAAVAVIVLAGCQQEQVAPQSPSPDAVAVEPGTEPGDPLGATNLRSNQVRTRHLFDGSVTAAKLGMKSVTATVTAGTATVTTSADTDLAGGLLIGCHPATNQDQHVDNIVLNANGSITVTLAANATANNVFSCKVFKPNAKGIS